MVAQGGARRKLGFKSLEELKIEEGMGGGRARNLEWKERESDEHYTHPFYFLDIL